MSKDNIESIKDDVGCLTYIVIMIFLLFIFNSCSENGMNKQFEKQNEILKQILYYQEQAK